MGPAPPGSTGTIQVTGHRPPPYSTSQPASVPAPARRLGLFGPGMGRSPARDEPHRAVEVGH
eukprot:14456226-Alexandrium_andersonii.AAC.1